jgi:ComF family protein
MKKIIRTLQHFFYPTFCPSCRDEIQEPGLVLCNACSHLLELIDPQERCPFCFTETDGTAQPCVRCKDKERFCDYVACSFDYRSPAQHLIHEFKYRDRPYLAKGLAALLFLQFVELQWPDPDYIVCIPQSFSKYLRRGYNQGELLAKEFANFVKKPVANILHKHASTISQTHLRGEKRKILTPSIFRLHNAHIEDKIILLIDDVYTTGATIEAAAQQLQKGHPHRIYALTVLRS